MHIAGGDRPALFLAPRAAAFAPIASDMRMPTTASVMMGVIVFPNERRGWCFLRVRGVASA